MSLPKHTLVAILSLNECVPESHGVIWTTKKEMTQRLIHCGVHNSLETIDVADAIQKHNQGGRINKNRWKDYDTYFRPGMYFLGGTPKDQREGQSLSMPPKNYFKMKVSAKGLLKIVNEALKQVYKSEKEFESGTLSVRVLFCSLFSTFLFLCKIQFHVTLFAS